MISFSDKVIMSALTNLVDDREQLEAASPGPWDRLSSELVRLNSRLSDLEVLSVRIDEYFSMSPEQAASSVQASSDFTEFGRDEYGDVEFSTSERYDSGY